MAARFSATKMRDFLTWYESSQPRLALAAEQLQVYLREIMDEGNVTPHLVAVRVKDIDAVRGKLLRKRYSRPRTQLTDAIGARIIVYHADEVDQVASLLRTQLEVRERDTADKRLSLGLREFGYRSYHLIGKISTRVGARRTLVNLKGQVFEIQVRSILEHVWAEIEHSVAYKSGAHLPDFLKRRFASLAAVLEMLEREFQAVKVKTNELVERELSDLRKRPSPSRRLDVPTLLAFLEVARPHGRSFRAASFQSDPFPAAIEYRFLLALQRVDVRTTGALKRVLDTVRFRQCSKRYATHAGVPSTELSHLAVLALVLGVKGPMLLRTFFPEFASDLALGVVLDGRNA